MDTDLQKISQLAHQVLSLAQDDILIHFRFLDRALLGLKWKEQKGSGRLATDGAYLYYDPVFVLKKYQEEPRYITRSLLHLLLHCIFSHSFQYDKLDRRLWDLAADIAVENVIMELAFDSARLFNEDAVIRKSNRLREEIGALTADRIYKYLKNNSLTEQELEELTSIFKRDEHDLWMPKEELEMSIEQWKKISERIKADLKSFTKARAGAEILEKNLEETTRDKYNYSEILKRFMVMGEDIGVNDNEFDYIYYTYGLEQYGNLPLIEPLEYKEAHKIKEFVIAIDTSASCRGAIVRAFLQKTYSILKSSENFFHKVNIHIIQCDNEVQSDTKLTCDEDFEKFLQYGKLKGFGATDFRPVFSYVERLKAQGEFENLKGLIYFTDGYGVYPEKMPDYDVIFAFLEEDEYRAPVPPWSIKVVLEDEELKQGAFSSGNL